jgi:hypothetical protein
VTQFAAVLSFQTKTIRVALGSMSNQHDMIHLDLNLRVPCLPPVVGGSSSAHPVPAANPHFCSP